MTAHLALPVRIDASGRLVTVTADTVEAVAQSVAMLLGTRPGERLSIPDYGMADPTWVGVDPAVAIDAITRWEPRADVLVDVDRTDADGQQTAGFAVRLKEVV